MWSSVIENPRAIEMFQQEPSLENITLSTLLLEHEGPTVTMVVQLRDYPASPPAKWRLQDNNAVTMDLQALGVEQITLSGWSTENQVSILIERAAGGQLRLRARGTTTDVEILCGWLRIIAVTPYRRNSQPGMSAKASTTVS
ncbi:MAG: immunity 50 family protein [Bryobacteraceae bacterium]|nr:immunity 50 family protein [Bryobacteraceae bacterium]